LIQRHVSTLSTKKQKLSKLYLILVLVECLKKPANFAGFFSSVLARIDLHSLSAIIYP
jgi:hypothetical protein